MCTIRVRSLDRMSPIKDLRTLRLNRARVRIVVARVSYLICPLILYATMHSILFMVYSVRFENDARAHASLKLCQPYIRVAIVFGLFDLWHVQHHSRPKDTTTTT